MLLCLLITVYGVNAQHDNSYTINKKGQHSMRLTCDVENLDFEIDTVALADSRKFGVLSASGYMNLVEIKEGYPQGPYKIINVEVPFLSRNYQVSGVGISLLGSEEFKLPLLPAPRPVGKGLSEDYVYEPNMAVYSSDASSPNVYVHDDYIANGSTHVVSIAVPLFGYDCSRGIINQYSQYDIELEWEDCPEEEMHSISLVSQVGSNMSDQIKTVVSKANVNYSASKKHYIVASECFKDKLIEYVTWKREMGFIVKFESLEKIKTLSQAYNPKPLDDAEGFRMWLKKEYESNGEFSLLIIGSEQYPAPFRKFATSKVTDTMSFCNEAYVPSDVYYVDLTSKYTLYKTPSGNFSTETGAAGYSPLIPVGRLMLHKQDDLDNYMWKRIVYDLNPGFGDIEYLDKLFVLKQKIAYDNRSLADVMNCYGNKLVLRDNKTFVFETSHPTGAEVIQNMAKCGMLSLQGHGNPATIATSGNDGDAHNWRFIQSISSYSSEITNMGAKNREVNNGIDLMNNIGKPSIAYSISCTVIPFDYLQYDDTKFQFDMPYNVGAAYTVSGRYGGVAFIGNTRPGYLVTAIPMELSFGESCLNYRSIGSSVNIARSVISDKSDRLTLNILGDPDISPWLGAPKLTKNDVINGSLLVLRGDDLAGSVVHIWNGMDKTVSVSIPEDQSIYRILKSDLNAHFNTNLYDFSVNITKPGCLPDVHLVSRGVAIANKHKRYILRDLRMSKDTNAECYYSVSNNGILDLKCFGTFESTEGLIVGEKGNVKIDSEVSATFEKDIVKSGGQIEVCAPIVVLKPGFSVEAGGKLTITTK